MEPIISPWIIYLIDKLSTLNIVLTLLPLVFIGIFSIVWMFRIDDTCTVNFDKKFDQIKKIRLYVIAIIIFIIGILIPSKETVISMIVVQHITPDNLTAITNVAKEVGEDVKGGLIEVIQAVKE